MTSSPTKIEKIKQVVNFHMTASPRMIKRCWIKAGLLAEANEEGEVELPIPDEVDEEVVFMRELTENYENMVMEEGTSNSVLNPTEEQASDDDVVLYEVVEPALESPVMEAICENPTRKKEKMVQRRIGDFFSKK